MDPVIADKKPMVMELEPGTYHYCACGTSKNQPFCDGSHKGTGLSPKSFEVTEKKKIAICMCRQSANGYQCDGTHASL